MFKKLINIQNELKAPKNQKNTFGNYKYRSCEDILEALKPILHKEQCYIVISDTIINIGDRYYIQATVKLFNLDGALIAENQALAREEENKKGMDGSQITGASSSYARKYALNGLFGIDDTKDSDYTNKGENKKEIKEEIKEIFEDSYEIPTLEAIKDYMIMNNYSNFDAEEMYNYYNKNKWRTKQGEPIKDWEKIVDYWENKAKEKYQALVKKGK